jgi:rRNA maturation endonuclease Nob1
MGSTFQAKCPYGYKSDLLSLGGGMKSYATYFGIPAFCLKCGELKVVNYFEDVHLCEKCGGRLILYNNPLLSRVSLVL